GERGSFVFRLHWSAGKIIALGGSMILQPAVIPFLRLGENENEFAGYHLGMAKNVRISFLLGDDGFAAGLTVHHTSGNVTASKTR
ncbi:MAG: hypothetical protein ACE5MH_09525, partial [Terriglobia bacterium]